MAARRTASRSSARRPAGRRPAPRDFAAIAAGYCRDVIAGKVPACKLVVAACGRHLDDLKASRGRKFRFRFDEGLAARACRFIEKLPHVKGDWAKRRELVKLEPFQVFIVASIFGWVWKRDGLRRFRKAYIEVPRKNAKSTLAAGIGIYLTGADGEEGAEVYCGATSLKQANEVFRPAQRMVDRTPKLKTDLGLEVLASAIEQEHTGSKMEPIIGKPGDGASPSCAIVDEFHEHTTPELYDTMQTGMGARSQPLTLVITTAGVDLAGPCYQMHLDAVKVLEGAENDDELFTVIYTVDDGDDWTSDEVLWKANPNCGVSVNIEFLRSEQRTAIRSANKSGTFRTKHLNQWVTARSPYFNIEEWKKGEVLLEAEGTGGGRRRLTIADFPGEPCILYLDLASKKDLAACLAVFNREGTYWTVPKFWLPESRILEVKSAPYDAWRDQGWIEETPGNIIDFELIEEYLRELKDLVEIQEVAYDPFQATQLVTRMRAEGFPMVECGATVKNFSEPMKALDALILVGKVKHDGSPVQTWCMANVTAKADKKDNVFPNKERPESKIDGAVALIGAMGRWLSQDVEDEPPSYHVRLRA